MMSIWFSKAIKTRTLMRYGVISLGVLLLLVWGGRVILKKDGAPSFFADIQHAFSSMFLEKEEFRGSFQGSSEKNIPEQKIVETSCSFDTLERPLRTSVIFNEIAWMGTKDDPKAEWLELSNRSDEDIDLSRWQIRDRGGDISFSFPEKTFLKPGAFMVVYRGKEKGMFSGSLKNSDEMIRLFDSSCVLQDEAGGRKWEAGNNATKQTMERDSLGFTWHTSLFSGGTPGEKNSVRQLNEDSLQSPVHFVSTESNVKVSNSQEERGVAGLETSSLSVSQDTKLDKVFERKSIEIVEVKTGIEGSAGYEYIRLRNPTNVTVSLTGWIIKKKTATGKETTLVSSARLNGKSIAPGRDFLLAHEGGYTGTEYPDVWWPKSYTLAEQGNVLLIYNQVGEKVSEYAW